MNVPSDIGSQFDKLHCATNFTDEYHIKGALTAVSGFITAFIVEFSVMGCLFFYHTWSHIHTMSVQETAAYVQSVSLEEEAKKKHRRVAKRHNLCAPLARANWSNSTCGMVTGSICLLVTVLVLIIFTTADTKEAGRDLEYGGKVLLTLYCTVLYCTALGAPDPDKLPGHLLLPRGLHPHPESARQGPGHHREGATKSRTHVTHVEPWLCAGHVWRGQVPAQLRDDLRVDLQLPHGVCGSAG